MLEFLMQATEILRHCGQTRLSFASLLATIWSDCSDGHALRYNFPHGRSGPRMEVNRFRGGNGVFKSVRLTNIEVTLHR